MCECSCSGEHAMKILEVSLPSANDHVTRFTRFYSKRTLSATSLDAFPRSAAWKCIFPPVMCLRRPDTRCWSHNQPTNTSSNLFNSTFAHNTFLDTQCHSFIIAIMQCSIMCFMGFNCYNFFQAFAINLFLYVGWTFSTFRIIEFHCIIFYTARPSTVSMNF